MIHIRTDTDRIEWLSRQDGFALFSDDAGHWAISDSGLQDVTDDPPEDLRITRFVTKAQWRASVRAAIDIAMDEDEQEGEKTRFKPADPASWHLEGHLAHIEGGVLWGSPAYMTAIDAILHALVARIEILEAKINGQPMAEPPVAPNASAAGR